MANWNKITSRGNVEDRRGANPLLVGGGGIGIVGIIITILFNVLGGGDATDILNQLETSQVPTQQIDTTKFQGVDDYEVFTATVLGSSNDMWGKIFSQNGLEYSPPKLVLFRQATQSGCGIANSAVGPHYCPNDRTIYLDETFFDELQSRFKAKGGDVAQAYVIAHEVGHHVQNELGLLETASDNEASIRQELQADCFAGLWAHSIKDMGVFETGEISEALDAAAAVGDDRIQQTIEGRVNPEQWTHGSSQDRTYWFTQGFESGNVSRCDRL